MGITYALTKNTTAGSAVCPTNPSAESFSRYHDEIRLPPHIYAENERKYSGV